MTDYEGADEIRVMLDRLGTSQPRTKDDMRRHLERRKLENLIARRPKHKAIEHRAIGLLRLPDYSNLHPVLHYVTRPEEPLWRYYRDIVSSAPANGRVGRWMHYFCIDANTGGVLGVAEVNSELNVLPGRDRLIGWTRERRFQGGGLRHVGNVGTCVCVAPFGRMIGGKCMIVQCLSTEIATHWQDSYGDELAALTTTSLFGRSSIYNRIKEWSYLGLTSGAGVSNIPADVAAQLRQFMHRHGVRSRRNFRSGLESGRMDVLQRVCQMIRYPIARLSSNMPKGIYFASRGDGAIEFLRDGSSWTPLERSMDDIATWWNGRWNRYSRVAEEVESFDFDHYGVDAQINRLRRVLSAGDGEQSDGPPSDAGATPAARSNPGGA